MRNLANDAGYPKLYKRTIDGTIAVGRNAYQFLNEQVTKAVSNLRTEFAKAQENFTSSLVKSPCLAVIAEIEEIELINSRQN